MPVYDACSSSFPLLQVYWYAGGAGFSKRFKMPAYQFDAVTSYLSQHASALPPPSTYDASMRAYPDVVALAWGVPMVTNGTNEVSGGTSASAPVRKQQRKLLFLSSHEKGDFCFVMVLYV